jgi:hypothetical protein
MKESCALKNTFAEDNGIITRTERIRLKSGEYKTITVKEVDHDNDGSDQ